MPGDMDVPVPICCQRATTIKVVFVLCDISLGFKTARRVAAGVIHARILVVGRHPGDMDPIRAQCHVAPTDGAYGDDRAGHTVHPYGGGKDRGGGRDGWRAGVVQVSSRGFAGEIQKVKVAIRIDGPLGL